MNKQFFLDTINTNYPSNFKKFNYDFLPADFKLSDKVQIECQKHGIFEQTASQHFLGSGCRKCGFEKSAKSRTVTTEEFVNRSKTKFGNKFNYEKTIYTKKGFELTLTCPDHGDFSIRPEAHLWLPYGCPICNSELPKAFKKEKVLKKAKEIHNGKYNYSKVIYENMNDKVEIICPTHGSFWQSLFCHVNKKSSCPICVTFDDRLTTIEFINKSKAVHGDKYLYNKVIYKTNATKVTITCRKHGDFFQRAASHLAGNGCKKCFLEGQIKTNEEFIKDARSVHGNKYNYKNVLYRGKSEKVEIICPTHGSFWQTPNSHLSSSNGCKICSESKGENVVALILEKYKFNFIREYKIKPYPYRYDFYLTDLNIFIEFNGFQHYRPIDFFGGVSEFLKVQERDKNKKQIISANDGHLVIITYMHLNEKNVEKQLIYSLKRLYKYWFLIDGKIQVFKVALDVYNKFNIPMNILIKDIETYLKDNIKNFEILF